MVPTMTQPLSPFDYLKKILTARVYDVAVESDLQPARALSRRLHNKVLLKREDQQPVFSFKLRGAYNKMAQLTPEQLQKGVICASAGNHAQGVAMSARKLGVRAVIVMPTTTPQVKIDAVQALGGEVVLAGDSYSDAYEHAVQLQAEQGLTFIHPFDDPEVIAQVDAASQATERLLDARVNLSRAGTRMVPFPSRRLARYSAASLSGPSVNCRRASRAYSPPCATSSSWRPCATRNHGRVSGWKMPSPGQNGKLSSLRCLRL